MSANPLRPSMIKRERESSPFPIINTPAITNTASIPAKRQRMESQASEATAAMSTAATASNVPNATLQVYRNMMPSNPEGIAFLFGSQLSDALRVPAERVAIQYQITKEDAIEEFRRLLAIKVFTVDTYAKKISPTPLMDELWHATILDTQLYANLQVVLGVTLHHRPSGASEQESERREHRLAAMKAMYRGFFSADPRGRAPPQPSSPPQLSPPEIAECSDSQERITIHVVDQTGEFMYFTLRKQTSIKRVKEAFARSSGVSMHSIQLFFGGARARDDQTVEYIGISNGDTLKAIREQVGC